MELRPAEAELWSAYRLGEAYGAGGASVRAEVIGRLLLDGPSPVAGRAPALKLVDARVTGALVLANSQLGVPVELTGCDLEAPLLLSDCRAVSIILHHCTVPQLVAERISTVGDLSLRSCKVSEGIQLQHAQIGTDLLLTGSIVAGSVALQGDGLNVGQDMDADLLEAGGEITLRGARVGGSLSLRGVRLHNPRGRAALNAVRLTVEETLWIAPAALPASPDDQDAGRAQAQIRRPEIAGTILLDQAVIGGALTIERLRAVLEWEQRFSLRGVQTPELIFTPERMERGTLDLGNAAVGRLIDSAASWPGPGQLEMRGFTYEQLMPRGSFPLSRRLEWLAAATPEFLPEPYDRLAASLRTGGEDEDAGYVMLAKIRRAREVQTPSMKLWGYVQDWSFGYGYRPGRAGLWLMILWAIGTAYFGNNQPQPIAKGEGPHWQPAIYVLDLLLPVLDLGQEAAWRTTGFAQWLALLLTVIGWLLATIVTAGAAVTILRRN